MFDHVSRKSKHSETKRQRTRRVARVVSNEPTLRIAPTPAPQPAGAVRIFKDGTAPFHIGHEVQAAGR